MLGFESNYVVKCCKTISRFLIRPVAKFQNLRCILPSDLFRGIPMATIMRKVRSSAIIW